ncbi:MAG TPA: hypothetical protein VF680_11745 [Allosphingosinicella sp.]
MSAPFGETAFDAVIRARPDSVPVGAVEQRIWKPFGQTKAEAWAFVDAVIGAAKKFDHDSKMPGDRMGKIGPSGLKVLEALLVGVDFMKGRIEPSIATIMGRAKLARATVVRALSRLKDAGFLWWIRRKVELDTEGAGPRIHQATNAYWFKLRGRAAGLVRLIMAKRRPPPPDDAVTRREQDAQETEAMLKRGTSEDAARFRLGDSPLGDAFASLGRLLDHNASSIESRNPDRQSNI